MSSEKLFLRQVNTNKQLELRGTVGVNLFDELLEITKKKIANIEGCPE